VKCDLLTAVMCHRADRTKEQLVLKPDLLWLAVVLDIYVDRHRKTTVTRLRHLVRRFLDYCNAQRNSVVNQLNKCVAVCRV